ncbi:MAG: tetratricopeptide repeat protein [Gemmataceae bacterium]|nr:tetratricopeptide repeat protein [Gemmataceae bacterium]
MRRKLNLHLLLWCLAGLLAMGVGTHFLHAYQVHRNAGILLRQADVAEEQGQLAESADYLSRYLGLVPDDAVVLANYGLALAKLAKTPRARCEAFFALEQGLRRAPDRDDVRRRLVAVALELRRVDDARDHLLFLLGKSPADGALMQQMGQCEEAKGRYPAAADWYARAIQQQPHEVENYVRRAHVLRDRLRQTPQAEQTMEQLAAANKDSFQAHLARARFYREFRLGEERTRESDLQTAATAVARARVLAPQDIDVLLESAEVAQLQGNRTDARLYLQRAAEMGSHNVRVYQALATLEQRAGRRAEAIASLRRGLQAMPNRGELLWPLAELLIEGDETAEAIAAIARLEESGYAPPLVDYLKARQLMKRGEWHPAAEAFEAVLPLLAAMPDLTKRAHLFLGQCHGQLGDAERQYAACRQVLKDDPLWVPGCLQMGAALAALGRIDEALQVYRTIESTEPQVKVLAARLLLMRTLRTPPGKRSWAEAEKALDEAEARLPEAVEVPLLRAEFYSHQDSPQARAKARDVLAAARDRQPKQVVFWVALADLAFAGSEEPLKILDEAERKLGDRAELRLARIRYWAARPGAEAAAALAKLGDDLGRFTAEDRRRVLLGWAEACAQIGNPREALRICGLLAAQRPNDLMLRMRMFDLATQVGDEAALQPLIEEVRRIEGEAGALWRYGKACQLIRRALTGDKSGLEEAETLLAAAAVRRPRWAQVCLRRGEVRELSGDSDAALGHYQKAIELGDRAPDALRRVVQLLYERHRYAEADQTLQKLQEQAPQLGDLNRLGAEVALRQKDMDRALSLARKAVSVDSKDYRALLWLGQVLLVAGKPAEAEPVLQRAVTVADQVPETWVVLVHALVRIERKEQAEAALRAAEEKLPNTPQKALALASCYEAVGRRPEAKKQYEAALAAQPQDAAVLRSAAMFYLRLGALDTAERHLRSLMGLQGKAPDEAAWARRTLALGLAASGNYQRSQTALSLLGLADGADKPKSPLKETVDNRRAQAVVLAVQKNTRQRREAIARLEVLRERREATADDQFLLAQLYDGIGDWPKARDRMQMLLAENGDNAAYLAFFVQGLLRRDDADTAETWFTRLEQREPNVFRTRALKALLLYAQGKGAEAVPLLEEVAREDSARAREAAQVLEQIRQAGAAEKLLRAYVAEADEPERTLVLAAFLGRQNRPDEALALCEPAWKTCTARAVADTSVTVLYRSKVTPEQCQRVAGWLDTAIRKTAERPEQAALRFQLANVRHMQGRHEDAVTLYRQVIEQEPSDALALNNLAWLLVLKEGKAAEALALILRAVQVRGDTAELLDTRGVVYLALGKNEDAVQDLEEANAQAPTASRWLHLARAYQATGKQSNAVAALRRADKLGLHEERLEPLERALYRQVREQIKR